LRATGRVADNTRHIHSQNSLSTPGRILRGSNGGLVRPVLIGAAEEGPMSKGANGCGNGAPWRPEEYLPLLRLRVRQMQLAPRFRRLLDSMDLVHGALAKALAHREDCKSPTKGGRVKWLQTILKRHVIDELRKIAKAVEIEQQVDEFLTHSSLRLEDWLQDS